MDERTAGNAGRRSRAQRGSEPPERRRRELLAILGHGLARVIERCPADPGGKIAELSESSATRVELPGDPSLSVASDGAPAPSSTPGGS